MSIDRIVAFLDRAGVLWERYDAHRLSWKDPDSVSAYDTHWRGLAAELETLQPPADWVALIDWTLQDEDGRWPEYRRREVAVALLQSMIGRAAYRFVQEGDRTLWSHPALLGAFARMIPWITESWTSDALDFDYFLPMLPELLPLIDRMPGYAQERLRSHAAQVEASQVRLFQVVREGGDVAVTFALRPGHSCHEVAIVELSTKRVLRPAGFGFGRANAFELRWTIPVGAWRALQLPSGSELAARVYIIGVHHFYCGSARAP